MEIYLVSVIRFFFLLIASSIFSGITLAQEQINTSSKNSEIIMGYYPQWGIYSPNIHIHDLPLDLMTHFVYMNAGVNEKGEVYVGDPYADIEHFYPNSNLEKEAILGDRTQFFQHLF